VQEKFTSKYLDLDLGPQFAFGHGSGYAVFSHSAARLSRDALTLDAVEQGETVRVTVDVTNTSDRSGDEVVQAYLEDVVASVAPPVRRLVAFERRTIESRDTVTVSFELGTRELGFWSTDGDAARFVVEPGLFRLHVGSTLERTQSVEFHVGDRPATNAPHQGDPR
jgi:beta-glucosidase